MLRPPTVSRGSRTVVVALGLAAWAAPAPGEPMFALTERHLALLRQAIVVWAPIESGVPAVLPSPLLMTEEERPALYLDLARRSGVPVSEPPTPEQQRQLEALLQDLPEALALVLAHGRLSPGTYTYSNPLATLPERVSFVQRIMNEAVTKQLKRQVHS